MNRRALLLAPFGVAIAGGAAFYAMLDRMKDGSFDPRGVPSMLIGKHVPPFTLPGQAGAGFADTDLAAGHPILVNFFASWCVPCVEEAPALLELKQQADSRIRYRLQGQDRSDRDLPRTPWQSLYPLGPR